MSCQVSREKLFATTDDDNRRQMKLRSNTHGCELNIYKSLLGDDVTKCSAIEKRRYQPHS